MRRRLLFTVLLSLLSAKIAFAGPKQWGFIANEQLTANQNNPVAVTGSYFFAGPPKPSHYYTIVPTNRMHLDWSRRNEVMQEIKSSGFNTLLMSSWGVDPVWAEMYAPMQITHAAQEELFSSAHSAGLLIMPAIETYAGNTPNIAGLDLPGDCWYDDPAPCYGFVLSDSFRLDPSRIPAGQNTLSAQIIDLINRHLKSGGQQGRETWAQLYNAGGERRYAVNLLFSCARQLNAGDDELFLHNLEAIAENVQTKTGFKIGFTLDPQPYGGEFCNENAFLLHPRPFAEAVLAMWSAGNYPKSLLAIAPYRDEIFTSKKYSIPTLLNRYYYKKEFYEEWLSTRIPVHIAISGGYDARYVFHKYENKLLQRYPASDEWRNLQGMLREVTVSKDIWGQSFKGKPAGIVFDAWNGFTEGWAGMEACKTELLIQNPKSVINTGYWDESRASLEDNDETKTFLSPFLQTEVDLGAGNAPLASCQGSDHTQRWLKTVLRTPLTSCRYRYQRDGGSVTLYGAICDKWHALGGLIGKLGYPLRGEYTSSQHHEVRQADFQHGKIYWHKDLGSIGVWGAIYAKYQATGAESGPLGFPVEEEFIPSCDITPSGTNPNKFISRFQHGFITFNGEARVTRGIIAQTYAAKYSLSCGPLGMPITDEFASSRCDDGREQWFNGGILYWCPGWSEARKANL